MSEEQREKANRLGYDRLKEPPEDVSEEEPEKTRVERIAWRLEATGVLSFWGSLLGGIIFAISFTENTPNLRAFVTAFGVGSAVWFLCFIARYILKGVTDEAKQEKPNTMGRLGQALHWWGVAIAGGLLVFGAMGVLFMWGFHEDLIKVWGLGVVAVCVARTARYVLKGD